MRRRGTRRVGALVAVVLLALAAAGCGARLTDEEVREADEQTLSVLMGVR